MLSDTYKHLYFPINWENANSRSVAYLINTNHDRILSLLREYDFKCRSVDIINTRKSGNKFTVTVQVMPKNQWVLFLLLIRNPFRNKILKQLQEGKTLETVQIS